MTKTPPQHTSVQPSTIRRRVDLGLTLDQMWRLVATTAGFEEWFADSIDIPLRPGAAGSMIVDGERRAAHIDDVLAHARVQFTWWSADLTTASQVTLDVTSLPDGGSRLDITETLVDGSGPSDDAARADQWEVRVLSLWACTVAMALVR